MLLGQVLVVLGQLPNGRILFGVDSPQRANVGLLLRRRWTNSGGICLDGNLVLHAKTVIAIRRCAWRLIADAGSTHFPMRGQLLQQRSRG